MRRRPRVDWEEEAKKSRQSRIRGLRFTLLGFLAALVALVGAKARNPQLPLRSPLMVLGALVVGTLLMIALLARQDRS